MSDDQIDDAKAKFATDVKKILTKIGDYQILMGESSNPDCLFALLEYREISGGDESPIMFFF
uniref:Histamine release factor n=1 Tax=Parasteatoda tepidariorum TaxID=114398 RepID=A0A2L2Z8W5_PARTP